MVRLYKKDAEDVSALERTILRCMDGILRGVTEHYTPLTFLYNIVYIVTRHESLECSRHRPVMYLIAPISLS
jgi:hypothetical protein